MSGPGAQHGLPVLLDIDVADGGDPGSVGDVRVLLLDDLDADGLDDALRPGLRVVRVVRAPGAPGIELVLLVQPLYAGRGVEADSPRALDYQCTVPLGLEDRRAARRRPGVARQFGVVGSGPGVVGQGPGAAPRVVGGSPGAGSRGIPHAKPGGAIGASQAGCFGSNVGRFASPPGEQRAHRQDISGDDAGVLLEADWRGLTMLAGGFRCMFPPPPPPRWVVIEVLHSHETRDKCVVSIHAQAADL